MPSKAGVECERDAACVVVVSSVLDDDPRFDSQSTFPEYAANLFGLHKIGMNIAINASMSQITERRLSLHGPA